MEKSLVNDCMLFKLKGFGLCVLLSNFVRSSKIFYNKQSILANGMGLIDLNSYNEDLSLEYNLENYNIIAIRQCAKASEVLSCVLNDIEPKEWDWVREEKKEVKSVKLPICVKNMVNMLREDI